MICQMGVNGLAISHPCPRARHRVQLSETVEKQFQQLEEMTVVNPSDGSFPGNLLEPVNNYNLILEKGLQSNDHHPLLVVIG